MVYFFNYSYLFRFPFKLFQFFNNKHIIFTTSQWIIFCFWWNIFDVIVDCCILEMWMTFFVVQHWPFIFFFEYHCRLLYSGDVDDFLCSSTLALYIFLWVLKQIHRKLPCWHPENVYFLSYLFKNENWFHNIIFLCFFLSKLKCTF